MQEDLVERHADSVPPGPAASIAVDADKPDVDIDAAFVDLIRRGETNYKQWEATYGACRERAVARIRRRWPTLEDQAEDLFQIACQSALRALRNSHSIDNPAAWFGTIVMNAARKYLVRLSIQHQHIRVDSAVHSQNGPAFESDAPSVSHIYDDERLLLREAIDKLQPRQGTAVKARYFESRTYDEIGETLGCTALAAKLLVFHGLAALREMMKGGGNDC